MGNKCFKSKSQSDDSDVANNKKKKKNNKGDRYALDSPAGADGQANEGFNNKEAGPQGSEFTDLGNIHTDKSGNRIHLPSGQEQVTIELANGPFHERPIDVPGTETHHENSIQTRDKNHEVIQPNGANKTDNISGVNASRSKQRENGFPEHEEPKALLSNVSAFNNEHTSSSISDDEIKHPAHPLAESGGFTNPALQLSDDDCKSLSDISVDQNINNVNHDERKLSNSVVDQLISTVSATVRGQSPDSLTQEDKHSSASRKSSTSSSGSSSHISLSGPVQSNEKHHVQNLDANPNKQIFPAGEYEDQVDNLDNTGSNVPYVDSLAKETEWNNTNVTTERTMFEQESNQDFANFETVEPSQDSSAFPDFYNQLPADNKHSYNQLTVEEQLMKARVETKRLSQRSNSSTSSKSSKSSESSNSLPSRATKEVEPQDLDKALMGDNENHSTNIDSFNEAALQQAVTPTKQAFNEELVIEFKDNQRLENVMQPNGHTAVPSQHDMVDNRDTHQEDPSAFQKSPFGSLFPAFHFKNDGDGIEANNEISEIIMDIERIEDSLKSELVVDQDAEEMSRKIVEKLDEITALREQAELMFDNDKISEEDCEEHVPYFKSPEDVIRWYNENMDELNESVGMALLELSMLEDCEPDDIRQQFEYHRDVHSDLIRKKLSLTRLVSSGQPLPDNNKQVSDSHIETQERLSNEQVPTEALTSQMQDRPLLNLMDDQYGKQFEHGFDDETMYADEQITSLNTQIQHTIDQTDQPRLDTRADTALLEAGTPNVHDGIENQPTVQVEMLSDFPNSAEFSDDRPVNVVHPNKHLEDNLESLQSAEMSFNLHATSNEGDIASQSKLVHSNGEMYPLANEHVELNTSEIDLNFTTDNIDDNSNNQPKTTASTIIPKNESIASSEDERDTFMGVNQFATPYRLEDDLWSKIESPNVADVRSSLSQEGFGKREISTLERENAFIASTESDSAPVEIEVLEETLIKQTVERKLPHAYSSKSKSESESPSSDDEAEKLVKTYIITKKKTIKARKLSKSSSASSSDEDTQGAAFEPREQIKKQIPVNRGTMYDTDSSEEEVAEDTIVPIKRTSPVATSLGSMMYDEDSDIEEKEVNHILKSNAKTQNTEPLVDSSMGQESYDKKLELNSETREPSVTVSDEESDDSVEELINIAFEMDRSEQKSPVPTLNHMEYGADAQDDQRQKVESFSARLARDIVESGSSDAASLQNSPREPTEASQQSQIETETMQTQTENKQLISQHTQAVSSQYGQMQTDTPDLTDQSAQAINDTSDTMAKSILSEMQSQIGTRTKIKPVQPMYRDSSSDEEDKPNQSEDSDTENVRREYDMVMSSKPITKARPASSSDSDGSTTSHSSGSESESEEDQVEAQGQLRETLKDDIIGSIRDISKDDFKDLMSAYRDTRQSFKKHQGLQKERHVRSLWDVLEERKKKTDKHIHEGENESDDNQAAAKLNSAAKHSSESNDNSEYDSDVNKVEEGLTHAEELNQTIQLMDLEIVRQACENNNRDIADEMIQKHFELVEKMRKDKEESLAAHREKMLEKLKRKHNRQLSTSSSEDTCNEDNTNMKDEVISQEMNELTGAILEIIKNNREITEQELYELMMQYREEQQELIRKREYEKLRIQEKLRERLQLRKKEEARRREASESSSSDEDAPKTKSEADLDAEFYEKMSAKQRNGELTEEELGHMIDQHLLETEMFKKKLKAMVAARRKQKRHGPTASMKLRMVDDMMDERGKQDEQIRHLRQLEKQKADQKLQERINMKKHEGYADTPDLPVPRRPERKQNHTSEAAHISMNYENVEFDC